MDEIMLTPAALLQIALTTLGCTAVAMALALAALRLNRRGSIASQFTIVVAAAILAIVASTVAIVAEMFFSSHDLAVFLWVIGMSSIVSLTAAWLIVRRTARASTAALVEKAQRVGDGAVVDDARPGWREFDEVSAQLAETSERLAAARDEIAALDSSRRQFFAWISHDLRTPLAGIRAMTEALEDGIATDPAEATRVIRAKVDTVSRMVDDLFQLSKLETGTLELRPEAVVLLDIVSDAVVDVSAEAAERGVRVVQRGIDGHLLWADPRELTRAIGNLLANGVRHAPSGSEILVEAHTRDERIVVSVLDHGSGVASEDLGRMFDVGWRANEARSTESAGAGLGLAIVRGIVEAHGGEVGAENVPGGFRMSLTLPAGA
ncbi:sensor histidine kinase [Microbacterium halophytorum]|uniref:sensor histidine kinase n=1 Tax=Microbacterium halophytorum TaxID=2067568 RepID=UPI001E60562A|nr:HAMP domain-containing sensor histidine kinase [Microbacterium halophytorum]